MVYPRRFAIVAPLTALFFTPFVAGCSSTTQFAQFTGTLFEVSEAKADAIEVAAAPDPAQKTMILSFAAEKKPADPGRAHIDRLINKYARIYDVPASLVHSVVRRESTYNPKARNGIHVGLMQLNPRTAQTMGYQGTTTGLYDAETNLKYGIKYLAGAYLVAGGDAKKADRLYQSGYYYHAKRQGLLQETGLRG